MKISNKEKEFDVGSTTVRASRDRHGVVHLYADEVSSAIQGLGFIHYVDRPLQMLLTRIIGRGQLSELLSCEEETIKIDTFMRESRLRHYSALEIETLKKMASENPECEEARVLEFLETYCKGVNAAMAKCGTPWELRLVGYKAKTWEPVDCMLILRMMSYIGLAQTQEDLEKFIIGALADGLPKDKIGTIFKGVLPVLDEVVEGLKNLKYRHRPTLNPSDKFMGTVPVLMASNNWVVSGEKSASGSALMACDPHLEVNRLPGIWYETVVHCQNWKNPLSPSPSSPRADHIMGITVPGLPGWAMGRTSLASWSLTYGCADHIDYFLEEVKDMKIRRDENGETKWVDLDVYSEPLKFKKKFRGKREVNLQVYENLHGVLEVDTLRNALDGDNGKLPDGYYLTRAWSGLRSGGISSLKAWVRLVFATNVREQCQSVAGLQISTNFLFADIHGDIAYQHSGMVPIRKHNGLHPAPGWDPSYDWQGFHDISELPSVINPPNGFLCTANNDLNQADKVTCMTAPMGAYRADRIYGLLSDLGDSISMEDMARIQSDLFSRQAALFFPMLERVRQQVSDAVADKKKAVESLNVLFNWDHRYDSGSKGAAVFESFYDHLLASVFGTTFFGSEQWNHVRTQTAIPIMYYAYFDRILLFSETDLPAEEVEEIKSHWYADKSHDEHVRDALIAAVTSKQAGKKWGQVQQLKMLHMLFNGKLPRWTGFDYGPVPLPGNRSTVVQAASFHCHGRLTSFCPSYRMLSDMGTREALSILAGGVRDRRFSKYYKNDVKMWLHCQYKIVQLANNDGSSSNGDASS